MGERESRWKNQPVSESRISSREPFSLATIAAETMYNLWELEIQHGQEIDLDAKMRRLKDLSAYSLTHAEILEQRECVELFALGMFFGANSNPAFLKNQARLQQLSPEAIDYEGQAEHIEQEIALRNKVKKREGGKKKKDDEDKPSQLRLL